MKMHIPNVLFAITSLLTLQSATIIAAPTATTTTHALETRQIPQVAIRVARVWFKIGKAAFENFNKQVDEQNQNGAGFFRDFEDMLDSLPDPPADIDLTQAPTFS